MDNLTVRLFESWYDIHATWRYDHWYHGMYVWPPDVMGLKICLCSHCSFILMKQQYTQEAVSVSSSTVHCFRNSWKHWRFMKHWSTCLSCGQTWLCLTTPQGRNCSCLCSLLWLATNPQRTTPNLPSSWQQLHGICGQGCNEWRKTEGIR